MKHFASGLLVTLLLSMPAFSAGTDDLSKAKAQVAFVYKRLAGVPAAAADIDTWAAGLMGAGDKAVYLKDVVAKAATDKDSFYSVTVLDFAQLEGNKDRALVDGTNVLNDLTATIIGVIRDDKDYRSILTGSDLYFPNGTTYAAGSNAIYETLYTAVKNGTPLASSLTAGTQALTGLTQAGQPFSAGIFTLRGFGSVYYEAGTNRGPVRFSFINYFCKDMEDMSDVSRPDTFVRKDVDRAPGGDAPKFKTECQGCHGGLDPLSRAFAFLDFIPAANANAAAPIIIANVNAAVDTGGTVEKVNRNADVFTSGSVTSNDGFSNPWAYGGTNAQDPSNPKSTVWWAQAAKGDKVEGPKTKQDEGKVDLWPMRGVKDYGAMMAGTSLFPECMAKRVYKTVCLKEPSEASLTKLKTDFAVDYNMKDLFKDAAVDCGTKLGGM